MCALARDANITILHADKGKTLVDMNSSDYKDKAKNILIDINTYKTLKTVPTPKYTATLIKKLKERKDSDAIRDIEYKRLYPTSSVIRRFYGLPKVHKAGAPLRPITASRGSLAYAMARWVADILVPVVSKLVPREE